MEVGLTLFLPEKFMKIFKLIKKLEEHIIVCVTPRFVFNISHRVHLGGDAK